MRQVRQCSAILFITVLALAWVAVADIPHTVSYQGCLTNSQGIPLDTVVSMTFAVYDDSTAGTMWWTESHTDVEVDSGAFVVILGSAVPIDDSVFTGDKRWLEITIGSEVIHPRTRLTSSPYAVHARRIDGFISGPGNVGSGRYIVLGGDSNTIDGDFGVCVGGHNNMITGTGGRGVEPSPFIGAGRYNLIATDYGAIVGGDSNQVVSGSRAFIGGGRRNKINVVEARGFEPCPFIGGGHNNLIDVSEVVGLEPCPFIGGGRYNFVASDQSVIVGGDSNQVLAGSHAVIVGGRVNIVDVTETFGVEPTPFIGGGRYNSISADLGIIVGGDSNQVGESGGIIVGGNYNVIVAASPKGTEPSPFIGGGRHNTIASAHSFIGGGDSNYVALDGGAVVGGYRNFIRPVGARGVEPSPFIGAGRDNKIETDLGVIAGGESNYIVQEGGVIVGGRHNTIPSDSYGPCAFIGGGRYNSAGGEVSFIGGGDSNFVGDIGDVVVGGVGNTAHFTYDFVGGGYHNTAGGGGNDTATVIAGGWRNTVTGNFASILGGRNNTASGAYSAIGGGYYNASAGKAATIGGGQGNIASDSFTVVSGGQYNTADSLYGTVGGGSGNDASGRYATVGGGSTNSANAYYTTVAGGLGNHADSIGTTVGGGYSNIAARNDATVSGGYINVASGVRSTVGGGNQNTAGGYESVVAGGGLDTASGWYSTIPGGRFNVAGGSYTLAAGRRAKARHNGAFVWADQSDFDFASTVANQFSARTTGGARFVTGIDGSGNATAGVQVAAGGGSWSSISDRNLKENYSPVDAETLLGKLACIPITTWNYKSQDDSIRHIGPTAQDFYAAFGVGEDEEHITAIDGDGVALAAIQQLSKTQQELKEKVRRIEQLETKVAQLEVLVKALMAKQETPGQSRSEFGVNR
jgi:hypothetical protein